MFDIRENLKKLPDSPGVYIHRDELGQVIYVGKAISLRNRVRQYFQDTSKKDPKVRAMVTHIREFEYITTATEVEALILECNLIKKYQPKYNVLLRDDKTYPYIKLTLGEEFPRVLKTRLIEKDGGRYFGPYSDAGAVNVVVDLLNDVYSLKRCAAKSFPEGVRPCLNYHIKQCSGICTGRVSREEYMERIAVVEKFLSGRSAEMTGFLKGEMEKASEALDFERAARYRDAIEAVSRLSETQRVVILGADDMDLILTARGEHEHHIVQFFVREGKLSGRESYQIQAEASDENAEVVGAFIKQHYTEPNIIPKEILVNELPEDSELIERFLSETRGSSVKLTVPKRGEKRALMDLARRDALEVTKNIDERARAKKEREDTIHELTGEIIAALGGPTSDTRPYRIEAYDISNTSGVDTVGAMVVFEGTKKKERDYRRFRVRTVDGPDDYASLQEVLYRRLKRAEAGDTGFSTLPDLILLDGGKGQITAVSQVLRAMRVNIPLAGMAKDDHHRTRALIWQDGGDFEEIPLAEKPILFRYIGTIQEEVHRYAIDYHRKLRGKRMQGSALDEIPGIGPVKRNALLAHFGSLDAIRSADDRALCEVEGITPALAAKIREFFN